MHICVRPLNMTRRACCQFISLLNDSKQIAPCTIDMWNDDSNGTLILSYNPPSYLPDPEEIREDHLTFLLGILILMILALACTFALSRITRPKLAVGYGSLSNYGMFMWLPSSVSSSRPQSRRRRSSSSFFVFLREMTCRRDDSSHRNTSSLSILSQMDMSLLPSYQTATATPTSTVSVPPPPYFSHSSRRGYQDEVVLPLSAVTSPAQSFHSYAHPDMTRSI